jgi:hypothetical protein
LILGEHKLEMRALNAGNDDITCTAQRNIRVAKVRRKQKIGQWEDIELDDDARYRLEEMEF